MSILHSYYRQIREHKAQHAVVTHSSKEFATSYLSLVESDNFLISSRQRRELDCILEEFKNRPLNQGNYMALQRELAAADLMPEQLFCYDLGEEQQRRGNAYMSHIVQSWQRMCARGK